MADPGPVLVGELNPYGDRPYFALYDEPITSAGGRMCRLVCGLHPRTYRALDRVNLCTGKWSAPASRSRAASLRVTYVGRVLVLLGRKVQAAFGTPDTDPYTILPWGGAGPIPGDGTRLVILPHPSGLCREWNVPGALLRARGVLARACPDVPWGEADQLQPAME